MALVENVHRNANVTIEQANAKLIPKSQYSALYNKKKVFLENIDSQCYTWH